jgi:hypothetical protein
VEENESYFEPNTTREKEYDFFIIHSYSYVDVDSSPPVDFNNAMKPFISIPL